MTTYIKPSGFLIQIGPDDFLDLAFCTDIGKWSNNLTCAIYGCFYNDCYYDSNCTNTKYDIYEYIGAFISEDLPNLQMYRDGLLDVAYGYNMRYDEYTTKNEFKVKILRYRILDSLNLNVLKMLPYKTSIPRNATKQDLINLYINETESIEEDFSHKYDIYKNF